ncbi:molecular chaperone DnaJ [Tistrella bauzanensis]|uniref:Molecular chaperone DnaJ n=1 Tax=Tistrella bauzanensis TaxID=657419 RepID=A0ABQ1J2F8_9PROT|nr:J domain-containing protein [Tistrella bauzanensis]GGB58301.1 molecular chaperone DnaJ [Tistrella bauzanensis]
MTADPYQTLGVARDATPDTIKAAYRRLAKAYHPDLHPGDDAVERRFKDVSAAYAVLSDPTRRAAFDRGDTDANGASRPRPQGRPRGDGGGFADFFSDIFTEPGRTRRPRAAGGGSGGSGSTGAGAGSGIGGGSAAGTGNTAAGRTGIHRRGVDVTYTLLVEFIEAARGTRKRIRLPEGRELEVAVPAGIRDGQKLRLSGQGMPGFGNAEAGDALVEVNVRPHPLFRADGRDILIDVPVTLPEAVLGAGIIVPTLDGPVRVAVPPGSSGGRRLRLKGRGMGADSGDRGDMFVVLRLVLPDRDDPALTEFVKRWKPPQDYDQVRRRAGIE